MDKENISCSFENGHLTLFIKGEIDHHSAKGCREAADKAIFYYRPKKCVIDLSGVDFMDSSGLGLILGRYSCINETGGELEIVGASERTERILKLAGVQKLISINKKDGVY